MHKRVVLAHDGSTRDNVSGELHTKSGVVHSVLGTGQAILLNSGGVFRPMRLKALRGLPVIDPTAARKVGTVLDYQVDPAAGRLAALDINAVESGEAERVLAHRIRRVGRHAVILTGRAGAASNGAPDLNEHWLDASSLVGLEVLGDDGNRIGRLMDAGFDQDSLDIDAYLLRATTWQRLTGVILPIMRPIIVTNFILVTISNLSDFTLIYALTHGGPGNATQTLPLYIYEQAFSYYELGYGTAVAMLLIAIGAVASLVYVRLLRSEVQ